MEIEDSITVADPNTPSTLERSVGFSAPQPRFAIDEPQTINPSDLQIFPQTIAPSKLTLAPIAPAVPKTKVPLPPTPSHVAPLDTLKSPEKVGSVAKVEESVKVEKLDGDLPPKTPTKAPESAPASTKKTPASAGKLTVELKGPINQGEYVEVPDSPEAPLNLSTRKRKRAGDDDDELLNTSLDQRQRADAAMQDLTKNLNEIFNAVGQAFSSNGSTSYMVILVNSLDGQEATLTSSTHQKVQASLQKVLNLGSFPEVPLEDLLRLQELSAATLRHMENLELRVDDTWGDAEVQTWIQQIPDVETAIKAARTALRIMSGGREDKQLYSEETIQLCIDLFKSVMDGIIVPIVELRNSGGSSRLFKALLPHKKALAPIFTNSQRLFDLMATLVTSMELSDSVINTLEFAAQKLIFVENAHHEKDSAVGVQKFDGLRHVAMNMLCQIFIVNPAQRGGIFDEILTSLEKLPVGKQSARQFKLADGGHIQPVSALIMRLVQSSSGKVDEGKEKKRPTIAGVDDEPEEEQANSRGPILYTIKTEADGGDNHNTAVDELKTSMSQLVDEARRNAHYVVGFIVNRALKSTKSGDTPYRNLLDLFVEDFTTCLDSPDWPAAELLLRFMMMRMFQLTEGEKTPAPARNMALDVLGTMGAAISRLRSHVRKTATSIDMGSDELVRFLSDLATSALERSSRAEHVVSWSGPYRATLEYLEDKCSDDPHLKSAISFVISDWANSLCTGYEASREDQEERDQEFGRLAYRLRMMLENRRWLSTEYSFKAVSQNHAKLAYAIILLRSPLFEAFGSILNVVFGAMSSDQATVRSKSLKSVNQVLETDPSILDGDSMVIPLILQCSNDSSPQVRDSALGLIGKCISMRPNLEEALTPRVIDRFVDAGIGARKRAMKLARDIYLRNRSRQIRGAIANGLLLRVQDPDEGVRDLARQMIEEVWFAPFYNSDNTPALQAALTDHVSLMIQIVKSGNVAAVLDKVLQSILGNQGKPAEGPLGVCTKLVANMFELIDTLDSDDPAIPGGRDALQVLMIFAKADAKLFTFEQIRLLKPHLSSFSTKEDLHVFRAAVVIYRRVLPILSTVHSQFFIDVRTQLLGTIGKISRILLDDVIACVWIICGLVNSFTPLARLSQSSLTAIQKIRQGQLNQQSLVLFQRYSIIVGMVGKHCDLDPQIQVFKEKFPAWKGKTVPSLMVDMLVPFALPGKPEPARKAALDAIGLVCQSWPRNYASPNVYTTFQNVFDDKVPVLEDMILSSFKEFLLVEEKRSEEAAAAEKAGDGEKTRELTVMGGTNYDDVASATTQRFLKEITRIALSSQDDHAVLAIEVLGSINRQGLVHPKETGVTFITLQTCANPKISELAFQEYRSLHEKHETVLEREYAKAMQSVFAYQRDVVKDVRGATVNPFHSKLHLLMEVLKISKSKNRQRFLEKLCVQVDFDPVKLNAQTQTPFEVLFARFILENLAFFEYVTVGEVVATLAAMEKIITTTGSGLAHLIESEVFNVRMDVDSAPVMGPDGQPIDAQPLAGVNVDNKRLRRLTAGAMILLCLSDTHTYLRRQYSLGRHSRDAKAKTGGSKDLAKAPVKSQTVTGDKFWEEIAGHMQGLASHADMIKTCRNFVEVMSYDKDFKVPDENDLDGEENPGTPSDQEEAPEPGSGRGRKRKGGGTPGRPNKRARSTSRPRKRGRPKKAAEDLDAEGEMDEEWI